MRDDHVCAGSVHVALGFPDAGGCDVPLPIVGTYGEPLAPKAPRVAQVHRRDERARRFCQKFQHGAFVIAQAYHVVTSLILQDADTIDARLTIRFVVERTHARPNTQHH
jgi:hypothetical protein